MANTDVTVYIGRFSPFHRGHVDVLRQALQSSKLVIVLVGSTGLARSLKNPFTFEERKEMINSWCNDNAMPSFGKLHISYVRDQPYNDALWIKTVQEKVSGIVNKEAIASREIYTTISLTGSDRDDSTWYLSAFPQWKLALRSEHRMPHIKNISATSIRTILFGSHEIAENDYALMKIKVPETTADFLMDFMESDARHLLVDEQEHITKYKKAWSVAPYAPTFVTVDAVVIQSGHVLVVERGAFPGKGLWALPGGFVNQNERLQDACIRELMEETGIKVPETVLKSIARTAPKEIFDLPTRSLRGRTITTAFLLQLDDTKPLPKVKGMNAPLHETDGKEVVETAKAFWLPLSQAFSESDKWFEDHLSIVETLTSQITSR